jgi:hypothetical protein
MADPELFVITEFDCISKSDDIELHGIFQRSKGCKIFTFFAAFSYLLCHTILILLLFIYLFSNSHYMLNLILNFELKNTFIYIKLLLNN